MLLVFADAVVEGRVISDDDVEAVLICVLFETCEIHVIPVVQNQHEK